MMIPDEGILKGLQKMAIRTEIADIAKRNHSPSLWVVWFTKENGRRPTDQECEAEITKLTKELEELNHDNQ
jgi:hypothetical protein